MKIKVIDLFKLMLERKAPKEIKVLGMKMRFIETAEWGNYIQIGGVTTLSDFRLLDCLNEWVEIIEEKPKKIDEEHYFYSCSEYNEIKHEVDKVLYVLRGLNRLEEQAI